MNISEPFQLVSGPFQKNCFKVTFMIGNENHIIKCFFLFDIFNYMKPFLWVSGEVFEIF